MIRSFRNKALKELYDNGRTAGIGRRFHQRILVRLDALRAATKVEHLNQPGFNFHPLRGKPLRYSIHVNGPWCITFGWDEPYADRVDFEQYH
jgi:proteic killer suppression protein